MAGAMPSGRSESAVMTSAEQARFRIDRPNSRPRISCIIALDPRSHDALVALKERSWNGARFLRYVGAKSASEGLPSLRIDATLADDAGHEVALMRELKDADTVVMVTASDASAEAAEIIGNACASRGIAATALVLAPVGGDGALGRILSVLRPHTTMLVVSSSADYVGEMLAALRA